MNTTVSIPTDIFEESQKTAQKLGMSLTEFLSAALRSYVLKNQFQNVTEKLNEIYDKESSSIDPNLMKMQVLSLEKESW
jgi:metal-responsive CopG/Arc/MetJ family transcriptional regulator